MRAFHSEGDMQIIDSDRIAIRFLDSLARYVNFSQSRVKIMDSSGFLECLGNRPRYPLPALCLCSSHFAALSCAFDY
jgi:hypothetical protein